VFGLASLRDLPDVERLEDAGLLEPIPAAGDLDDALGVADDEEEEED
jgi:segregation and condensation protein B